MSVKQLSRNFILSLGGEGLQSGFHFVLSLILIRILSIYDFGLFAIVLVLGGIALGYGNALVSVPVTIHIPRFRSVGAAHFQDVVFSSIALLISAVIAIIVSFGLWLIIQQPTEALAGGAFIGLWTLRNHVRSVMFARRWVTTATISDFCYAGSGLLLVTILLAFGRENLDVTGILVALSCANLLAIGVALAVLGRFPRVSFRHSVWQRYRAIWPDIGWSLVSTTTWSIQGQALMFLVAAIAGPEAYAPIAAGTLLFSPIRLAIAAVTNVFRPDFVMALKEERYHRLTMTLYSLTAVIVMSCLAAGLCIWLGWPWLEAHVFGAKLAHASMPLIVFLIALSVIIYSTYNVPLALIQAAGQFRPVALASALGSIVGLGFVSTLLVVSTVAWSVAGLVAGEAACGIVLWIAARRIRRQRSSFVLLRRPAPPRTRPISAATELS